MVECKNCGEPLHNNRKTYCDNACQHSYQSAKRIALYLSGQINGSDTYGLVKDFVRNYLYSIRGEACEICGWQERNDSSGNIPLHMHHIDGDADNSMPENLMILCPNHHALTNNYGNLNRGNGRPNRYK